MFLRVIMQYCKCQQNHTPPLDPNTQNEASKHSNQPSCLPHTAITEFRRLSTKLLAFGQVAMTTWCSFSGLDLISPAALLRIHMLNFTNLKCVSICNSLKACSALNLSIGFLRDILKPDVQFLVGCHGATQRVTGK